MFDELRAAEHPSWSFFGTKLVAFGIGSAFFEVWESSISLRCSWSRFSKAFGVVAGQPEAIPYRK